MNTSSTVRWRDSSHNQTLRFLVGVFSRKSIKMVYIPISEALIQNRIQFIFDFLNEASHPEPIEQRLNNAWHEIFGMQFIMSIADPLLFTDAQAQRELEAIRNSLAQALADVERVYDEEVER